MFESFQRYVLTKGIATFRGWILRTALKALTAVSASTSAFLMAKLTAFEQVASLNGASTADLSAIDTNGHTLIAAFVAFGVTCASATVGTALSRVSAKVAETPIVPHPIIVDEHN